MTIASETIGAATSGAIPSADASTLRDGPFDALGQRFDEAGVYLFPRVLPAAQVATLQQAAQARLAACLATLPAPLAIGVEAGYREIVQRAPGRFDVQYGMGEDPFASLSQLSSPHCPWAGLLRSLLGKEARGLFAGFLLTRPGAATHDWHLDGEHLFPHQPDGTALPVHCLNVFVPLIDVSPAVGTTELCPGSHRYTCGPRDQIETDPVGLSRRGYRGAAQAVVCPAGSVLIFDYRLSHRALQNPSQRERPVLYFTYARPWYHDDLNFPARRLFPGPSAATR